MNFLLDAFHGFCMALADSVPGVSGGSIAFILGFYDQFIHSFHALLFGQKEEKKEAFFFLLKLGFGWIVGMIVAILVITSLFEKRIYEVSSVFLGFIIFSLPFLWKEEKKVLKGKYQNLIFSVFGVLFVASITYFHSLGGGSVVDLSSFQPGLILYVFLAAMIAISAMVLPGISGSTILLIFGLYLPIINGIKELLHFHFTYFPMLLVFGFGVLAGIFLIVRLIEKALKKYRSQMIYFIIGLMLGSLYAIVMGPTTLEPVKAPLSLETFSLFFFAFGGILIFLLEYSKIWLEGKKK